MISNRTKTALEQAIYADGRFFQAQSNGANAVELQKILDLISDKVCEAVGPEALVGHTAVIYEETAPIYSSNPIHWNIPDTLLAFMLYLRDDDFVLDVACGHGRDAVFMALKDKEIRKKFMSRLVDGQTTLERFGVPEDSFRVMGIDSSAQMIHSAKGLAMSSGLDVQNGGSDISFASLFVDMHHLYKLGSMKGVFEGVWSSAGLFMHTPRQLVEPALRGVAHALAQKGVFGVSYRNNSGVLSYHDLRYSETGEIKYFSRPSREEVIVSAERAGLSFIQEIYSDFTNKYEMKKDFFVTQFFRKK